MKNFVVNTCVAILRKLNCSVMIGYKVDGDIQPKNGWSRIYDNDINGDHRLEDGTKFDIPNGKFSYKVEVKR